MDEERRDLFNVAVGGYDGAEVCELVRTFLLEKNSEICNESNIGLYRDGGLSIFRTKSGTQLEKIKKNSQRLLKEYDLKITGNSNQKIVNYLDLTLNLKDSNFRPYYIKHIPTSTENRLSNLSSTEILFKESTTHYEENLRESGYNKKLTYKPTHTNHQKHSKYRTKIIWFNSLFSKNISTKIGKSFFKSLRPTFPKEPHL